MGKTAPMRDIFSTVESWLAAGRPFALATLVDLANAAPAPLGATMAVASDGTLAGDIGAGCYEGEIVQAAIASASDGATRTVAIDLTDGDPVSGASGCGGFLEVVTWVANGAFAATASAIVRGTRDVAFSIPYERNGDRRSFEACIRARGTLVVVGATMLAGELASLARRLDYRTVVVDPRPAFATAARLPSADAIEAGWPDDVLPTLLTSQTPLLVISHDPKLDIPALRAGLASAAPFIGLLGSRRAQDARRTTLLSEGFDERALARIRGPVGLDLGGTTSAETALSILAEIVAERRGRAGSPLSRGRGAIHAAREFDHATEASVVTTPITQRIIATVGGQPPRS